MRRSRGATDCLPIGAGRAGHGAVHVGKGCRNVTVAVNTVGGRAQRRADIAGAADAVGLEWPERLPEAGPAACPLDGARHLAIERLEPWDEEGMWL